MKYPQVFVFFKESTFIDQASVLTTIGRKLDVHFGPVPARNFSEVDLRAKFCHSFLQIDRGVFLGNLPYVAASTVELNSLFVLKYSADIEGVVWVKSAIEFKKFRAGLTALKDYWKSIYKLDSSIRSYNRLEKVLGSNGAAFTYDTAFVSSLENHKTLLESGGISKAVFAQMHATGRVGKYQL